MKKILHCIIILILAATANQVLAQNNDAFSYQGVLRSEGGTILTNQDIALKINILNQDNEIEYSETHNPITTNPSGIFSILIGRGEVEAGSLSSLKELEWGMENYTIQTELDIDPTNGVEYQLFGSSPLVAVPLALHAQTVEDKDDADADPLNEIQTLQYNSLTGELSLSNGNTIVLDVSGGDDDADPMNEIQSLSFNAATNLMSISGSNSVDLSSLAGSAGGDDQNLSLDGNTLSIEDGNSVDLTALKEDDDADPNNEIQFLSFNSTTNELSLSEGNTISIPSGGTDADADPTNEIQDIELSGTELSITDGSTVDLMGILPAGSTDDQNIELVGTELTIESGNTVDLAPLQDGTEDADADPMNEIQTLNFDPITNELQIVGGNTVTIPSGGTDADADPTNEIQDIELIGTELSITDGSTVDLMGILPAGSTDDQNIELVGTELTIESGNTVDLAPLQDGTEDADADPMNEIQTLNFDPITNELQIVGGNTVTIPSGGTDADADPTNEIQDIELTGTELSITDGSTIDLASLQDGTEDADADPMNEIQTLNFDPITNELQIVGGNTVTIPSGGTDADADPTNEIQDIELSGTELSITEGSTIDLAPLQDGTEDADADPMNEIQTLNFDPITNELQIVGGNTVTIPLGGTDADADPTNEIQDISLTGTELSITNGSTVDLMDIIPAGSTDDQNLDLVGTELTIESGNTVDLASLQDGTEDADADPTNEIQDITLIGTEISISDGSTIDLATILPPGGTDDQNLELIGTELSIEAGNTVDLALLQDGTEDADADPTNEIQTLSFDPLTNELQIVGGNSVTIPTGGSDADADPMNEIQDLTYTPNGSTISLSDANTIQVNRIANVSNSSGITIDELNNEIILDVNGTTDMTIRKNFDGDVMLDIDNVDNLFIGREAGESNTGNGNSFLGVRAGAENTSGFGNTFVGRDAGESNSDGGLNTYIGRRAGRDNEHGMANVVIGANTGQNMEGDRNIFIGSGAGANNAEDENVFIGNLSGADGDGANNVFIGNSAGRVNDGNNNVFIGSNVGKSNFATSISTLLIDAVDTDSPLVYGKFDQNFLRINGELQISEEYSFPTIDGAAGQVLQTDGTGNVSWETVTSGGDADADPTNEIQDIGLIGTQLSITDGSTIDLAVIQDGTIDADADPVNELQNLNLVGSEIQITGGNSIDLSGLIPSGGTDDQELELTGNTLSIESGNSIDLGPFVSKWGVLDDGTGTEIGILYDKHAIVEEGMTIGKTDGSDGLYAVNAINSMADGAVAINGIATGDGGIAATFLGRTAAVISEVNTLAGDPGVYYGMRSNITGLGSDSHVGISGRAFSANDNYGAQGIVHGGVGITNNYGLHGLSFDVSYGTGALIEGNGILESTGIVLASQAGSLSEGIIMSTGSGGDATGLYNGVVGAGGVYGTYNYIQAETPTSFAIGNATEMYVDGDVQGNTTYINESVNGEQKFMVGNAITIDAFDNNSFTTGEYININSQSDEYVYGTETFVNSNYVIGNSTIVNGNNTSNAYSAQAQGVGVNVAFGGTAGTNGVTSNANFGMILSTNQGNVSQGLNISSFGAGSKTYVNGDASTRANADLDPDLNYYDDEFYASSFSKISGSSTSFIDAAVIGLNTVNKDGFLLDNYGGLFLVNGEGGYNYGVAGEARCEGNSSRGMGVYGGASVDNFGVVYGGEFYASKSPTSGGTAIGLYSFGDDQAGLFSGDVEIVGNLSKSGGTFKIDHPQDPENKYLVHSFVESPEMMNIYNGNITTDAEGYAIVEMPEYFEALNIDFRYQLTVIGTFAQAIVKEKIENGVFIVQTNEPNVEVSWMVTGVRNDPWAQDNRVVPELDKGDKRGTYLTPEYYGASDTQGEHYRNRDRHVSTKTKAKDTKTAEDYLKVFETDSKKNPREQSKERLSELKKRANLKQENSASDLDALRKQFNKE